MTSRHFGRPFPLGRLHLAWFLVASAHAGDLMFRTHVISAESEYSAVAVLDVNRDGRQDILCGGFWYEAPTWHRHFVRDVEFIRGRYDGYSHLPMDVNNDGWMDVITVNYRSRSIKWIEHPGAGLGPWAIHHVAEPGAMETGRLFDVDGDGRMDVLPNGQEFAAWWELLPGPVPQWTRHELPSEVAGHGLGFGDLNGDGRGDVIGPLGWAQAPADPRRERWVWNRAFDLGRASVPVLVVDVDEDGDNDLVWCRAHGFGVYWMEQVVDDGKRNWTHHTIDTSWSQCHSPLWADMDGDGKNELVAGKRYMAHEGRDPGAYDPLVSYRYQFNERSRTWQRWPISEGTAVGFGLDPKVVDLDADGDLDLVVCGRSGLYWLENQGPAKPSSPPPSIPTYEHTDLTIVKDLKASARTIETAFDWGLRRSHIVASIQQVVGDLPRTIDRVPLNLKILGERSEHGIIVRDVAFQSEPQRRARATIWLPVAEDVHAPGLILADRHGIDSTRADVGEVRPLTAGELAKRGYACIVPELVGDITQQNVWDCIRAMDVLESLPAVNGDRLGCLGQGMGAQTALLAAALDQRVEATLCTAPLRDSSTQVDPGASLMELIAAIAPRALGLIMPPSVTSREMTAVQTAVAQSAPIFELYPTRKRTAVFQSRLNDDNAAVRQDALTWLDEQLKRDTFGRVRSAP